MFIPSAHLVIEKNEVLFNGGEKTENQVDFSDLVSLRSKMNEKVINKQGKELGKIRDAIIDVTTKSVIGFKLNEGFWKNLFDPEYKYIASAHIVQWDKSPLIASEEVRLLDHHDDITSDQ